MAELSQAKGQDDPRNSSDRFSQLYLRPGAAVTDSDRMRNRLFALLESLNYPSDLYKMLRLRTGISVSNYEIFFLKAEIRDVLDAITVVFEEYVAGARGGGYGSNKPQQWLTGVAEIFAEEHVAYEVNRKGAVRFKIDEEFNRGHVTTIAALEGPRYRNAAKSFEEGFAKLVEIPPDGKGGIRSAFHAAEGLFRMMFNEPRLTKGAATSRLTPIIQRIYANDSATLGASLKQLRSFAEWIEAAHFYRHEPRTEEPIQPPLELAVNLFSSGAAHLRWLATLDAKTMKARGSVP